MKAFLLYKDRDLDLQQPLPPQTPALIQDLELGALFNAMARGDKLIFEVAKKVMLSSVYDLPAIHYRQQILQDCLNNASVIRTIYTLAGEALAEEKKHYLGLLEKYPDWLLRRSLEVLQMFAETLKKLRNLAEEHATQFESEGLTTFFAMLHRELDDDYLARVHQHLRTLKFHQGMLMSVEMGKGLKGSNYRLCRPPEQKLPWIKQLFAGKKSSYTFVIADRDESGARALSSIKDRGLNLVANALAQSVDHILSFFLMVRTELAFYLGCVNAYEQLVQKGEPVSFPKPVAPGERGHAFQGLYDVSLAFTMRQNVVGNDVDADGKDLVMITGANQGGKSTFLRSIGQAQLMMQCGMFVPARLFRASICQSLFTHYRRKEDVRMESGKLDEELSRMSEIVEHLTPHSMVLFNESFASTNEREGSEIARQIVGALLEKHIMVCFVTHFYDLAHGFMNTHMANALFLRAERQADGRRTFRLIEGEPLPTSYGEDLYHRIFGTETAHAQERYGTT